MARTITPTRRGRLNGRVTNRNRVVHDVDRIIKKAMVQTRAYGAKRKLKNFLTDSIENAKYKTRGFHRDLANYTYKKPFTTLGLAALTGAALTFIINKARKNRTRHWF